MCRDVYVSVYIEYCMLSSAAYLGHDYWALLHSSTMLKVLVRLDNQAESSFFDIRHCLAGIDAWLSARRAAVVQPAAAYNNKRSALLCFKLVNAVMHVSKQLFRSLLFLFALHLASNAKYNT